MEGKAVRTKWIRLLLFLLTISIGMAYFIHGFEPYVQISFRTDKDINVSLFYTNGKINEYQFDDEHMAKKKKRFKGCIYQYYGFMLNQMYNERVYRDGISNVAVAYRTNFNKKNNINFSKWAFDKIKQLGKAYVMIGDFTNFFDKLDHVYLKQQCCSLLRCELLPDDYYSVFKSVTAYSTWELQDMLVLNGLEDTIKGRKAFNRNKRVLTPKQFKENSSHIRKNVNSYGIPQGSSISAVLANIYIYAGVR